MNPDYLQKYYFYERNHWWFLIREKIIVQQLKASLPLKRPLRILNVGAATGKSSQMLQQFGDVTSVEKDSDTFIFLRDKLHLHVVKADIELLPFEDNFFDVVCIFDVIEHVELQDVAINELYRVCKNDGFLYCSVPAFSFLWSTHDEINHHKRRYTRTEIQQVLGKFFVVEYSTYFNFLLFLPIWFSRTILQPILRPQKMVSDFENYKLLNGHFFSFFFKAIFSIDFFLLRYFILPFGVSILLRAKKRSLLS